MDQADWWALGLLLAFLMGWFVAWLQESQYQKQLEKELVLVKARVQELERAQE